MRDAHVFIRNLESRALNQRCFISINQMNVRNCNECNVHRSRPVYSTAHLYYPSFHHVPQYGMADSFQHLQLLRLCLSFEISRQLHTGPFIKKHVSVFMRPFGLRQLKNNFKGVACLFIQKIPIVIELLKYS